MSTRRVMLSVFTASQILLWSLVAEVGSAAVPPEGDSDWPAAIEIFGETTLKGNPLDGGDDVYGLRGSLRFFSGTLGIEAGLARALPTSNFVRNLGGEAELLLMDLSAVWYVNYRQQEKIWRSGLPIKPEVFVFAGPGLASLRIDNPPPNLPPLDESKLFFTLNAGVGVKIHFFRTKTFSEDSAKRDWDRRTSRFFLRPELRARWFHGAGGEVDWTAGLALGYSFGTRPSCRSLALKAEEMVKYARSSENKLRANPQEIRNVRSALVDLKAQVMTYGARCSYLRERADSTINELNQTLVGLRNEVETVE